MIKYAIQKNRIEFAKIGVKVLRTVKIFKNETKRIF